MWKSGLLSFALTLALCAGFGAVHAESRPSAMIQGVSNDVQILQAWKGATLIDARNAYSVSPSIAIDLKACPSLGRDRYGIVRLDCSRQLQDKTSIGDRKQVSPLLNRAIFSVESMDHGKRLVSTTGSCRLLEIRAVIKRSALEAPTFQGIGFQLSDGSALDAVDSFVPKSRLQLLGKTKLRAASGSQADPGDQDAVVARFTGFGFCTGLGGNAEALAAERYDFKPYARYDVLSPSGQFVVYRNWENSPGVHALSGQAAGFDRQLDLIRR